MTDSYAAMMGAVLAAPDDNLPRLLLADAWEGGDGGFPADPARAELVRVQCEYAGLVRFPGPCGGPCAHDYSISSVICSCRRCTLRRRERDILDSHGMVFLIGILPAGLRGLHQAQTSPGTISVMHADFRSAYTFRRGFVEEVSISWVDWQANSQGLLASCPIANAKDGLVRITDQQAYPANRNEQVAWFHPSVPNGRESRIQLLTADFYFRLDGYRNSIGNPNLVKWYDTRANANAAFYRAAAVEYPGVRFELPAAHRDEEWLQRTALLFEQGVLSVDDARAIYGLNPSPSPPAVSTPGPPSATTPS